MVVNVKLLSDACEEDTCLFYSNCQTDDNGQAHCVCPTSCLEVALVAVVVVVLPTSLRPYCLYSVVQNWVFRPTGATHWPDKRGKFYVYRGRNLRIQPQNCQNLEFWP